MDVDWMELLVNEDLIEWEAQNGLRSLGHLLIYQGAPKMPVCVVGSFDGSINPSPEVLATVVGDRLGRDDFRLFVWYPRDSTQPFCELELSRIGPTEVLRDTLTVVDSLSGDQLHRRDRSVIVRFAHRGWVRHSEDEMALVLGEPAIRELRSFAGLAGEYVPERLFGSVGRERAERVREHNQRIVAELGAQISEWSAEP